MLVAVSLATVWPTAAAAAADTLQISVPTTSPEQGVPVVLQFSGAAAALSSKSGPYLYADVRPTGGVGCQPSFGTDQAATTGVSTSVVANDSVKLEPGAFTQQATFDPPDIGSYLICAWVENASGDDGGAPFPSSDVTAGPSTATFSAGSPQAGELSVALASRALATIGYQINYTTQTDLQLSLYSVVKPAGGLPCASSYELEQQANQTENDVFFGPTPVFGGPMTTVGIDTEQSAGSYIICAWIEGPNAGEVETASSTQIYVGAAPVGPPPPPPQGKTPKQAKAHLRLAHVTTSRRRGVSIAGTASEGLAGRVVVYVECGKAKSSASPRVRSGKFAVDLRLPKACLGRAFVKIGAVWHGSTSFDPQSISEFSRVTK